MRFLYGALLLLTSLLWAGNFVTGKWLVGHASPMMLSMLRWLIAVACMVPLIWWKEKSFALPRKAILPLIFMGITGVALFNVLQFVALAHTTASNIGLISTLNTVSIAVFASVLLKDRIAPLQIMALGISFFGVLLVLAKGDANRLLSMQFNIGDLVMLTAVGIWGIYAVFSKWAMNYVSPLVATFYSGIFGLLVLLPFSAADFTVTDVSAPFIWSLLYSGVIATVVCFVMWNIGVQKLGATASGVFLNFNPVFTAILAFLLLGEWLTWSQVIGSIIVIGGCLAFGRFKKKEAVLEPQH